MLDLTVVSFKVHVVRKCVIMYMQEGHIWPFRQNKVSININNRCKSSHFKLYNKFEYKVIPFHDRIKRQKTNRPTHEIWTQNGFHDWQGNKNADTTFLHLHLDSFKEQGDLDWRDVVCSLTQETPIPSAGSMVTTHAQLIKCVVTVPPVVNSGDFTVTVQLLCSHCV